jgi:hypothetical protein
LSAWCVPPSCPLLCQSGYPCLTVIHISMNLQVKEITNSFSTDVNRWTPEALVALQEVSQCSNSHVLLLHLEYSWYFLPSINLRRNHQCGIDRYIFRYRLAA